MKKIIIVLFLFANIVSAQLLTGKFSGAMDAYRNGDYSLSYETFRQIANEEAEVPVRSTAAYYAAESLYKLGELDGSSAEFEDFVEKYPLSEYFDAALYNLGLIYYDQGRYYKSRVKLEKLIKERPGSEYKEEAWHWIASSYAEENRFNEAIEYYDEAVSARKANRFIDRSIFQLARVYEATGKYEEAAAHYDELLAYYNNSELAPYAQLRIGLVFFTLKEYDRAVLELSDPMIQELPEKTETEANYLLANSFFRLKDYDNASKIYNEIIARSAEQGADNNNVRFGLAWVNFQAGNYDEAYRQFAELTFVNDETLAPKSLYWSGEAKRYGGEVDSAKYIYMKFLGKYPMHELASDVNYKLGVIFYRAGELDRAQTYLEETIKDKESPSRAKAFTLLGQMSLNAKKYPEAIARFDAALGEENIDTETSNMAMLGLGMSSYFTGDYQAALKNMIFLNEQFESFEKDKVNFYMGEAYFASKDYQNALKHFSRVSQADKSMFADAVYGRAYSFFNMKDFADATYYFTELLKLFPEYKYAADARMRLGDSYYGTKNFDLAAQAYEKAINQGRGKATDFVYYQYAQALFKSDNPEAAKAALQELQRRYPSSRYADDARYLTGWIYFQQGDYDQAIANYEELLSKYKNSSTRPIAYYSIGDAYYNKGEYDSSVAAYRKVIDLYPDTRFVFDAMTGIQYSYVAMNKPGSAVELIENYTANHPSAEYSDEILFKKGDIFFSVGEFDKAQTGYKEFIATYPESPLVGDAYYWIGKAAQNLGREEQAVYNFEIVKDAHLDSDIGISAVVELGKIFRERKDYGSEILLYDEVLKKVPDSEKIAELLYLKAKAEINNNNLQSAYATLDNITSYFINSVFADKARIELGKLELKRSAYETAEKIFGEIGNTRKDDIGAEAQYYYGVTLFDQEKYIDAITAFVRVRSVYAMYDEWYSKSLLKLGDSYVKIGDESKAREMYRAVAKKHDNDELGKEATKKLQRL